MKAVFMPSFCSVCSQGREINEKSEFSSSGKLQRTSDSEMEKSSLNRGKATRSHSCTRSPVRVRVMKSPATESERRSVKYEGDGRTQRGQDESTMETSLPANSDNGPNQQFAEKIESRAFGPRVAIADSSAAREELRSDSRNSIEYPPARHSRANE